MKDRVRLGGGAMLTEFGGCVQVNDTANTDALEGGGADDADACVSEIVRVTTLADASTPAQSWAYWQFKYFSALLQHHSALELD
jgi:hypothetical protein